MAEKQCTATPYQAEPHLCQVASGCGGGVNRCILLRTARLAVAIVSQAAMVTKLCALDVLRTFACDSGGAALDHHSPDILQCVWAVSCLGYAEWRAPAAFDVLGHVPEQGRVHPSLLPATALLPRSLVSLSCNRLNVPQRLRPAGPKADFWGDAASHY